MSLWITMVETIFRKQGQARQTQIDTWLTNTTPERGSWKDKYKENSTTNTNPTTMDRSRRENSRSYRGIE